MLRRCWMRVARPICTDTGRIDLTAATGPSASASATWDQAGSSVKRVPRSSLSRSTVATAAWVDCPESRSRAAVRTARGRIAYSAGLDWGKDVLLVDYAQDPIGDGLLSWLGESVSLTV